MKIGFLGGGNMGGALMQGLMKATGSPFDSVAVYDPSPAARERYAALGVSCPGSARELFSACDMTVLAVKPQVLERAVAPDADALAGRFVVSIAAGWTVERLRALLP